MFFEKQSQTERKNYIALLKNMASLSKFFSDNDVPYLEYRVAENIFCKAFNAENLSRSDISFDAKKNNAGIGLKTFILKNSPEKIAEFNEKRNDIDGKVSIKEKIKFISYLRNERLNATCGICNISNSNMLYHCVARTKDKLLICETKMSLVDVENIGAIKEGFSRNVFVFSDGENQYSFNFAKSTLYQKFACDPVDEISVTIIDNPYKILETLQTNGGNYFIAEPKISTQKEVRETIFLPLYSNRGGKKNVPERSGLNQWNAGGRARSNNEVYIPIPIWIHRRFGNFFPDRDTSFDLKLPSGKVLKAKVCQDNGKALMSDPNSDLGKWVLRDVLRLEEGEVVKYKKLTDIGIDSIAITKTGCLSYEINFKSVGSYERFEENYNDV